MGDADYRWLGGDKIRALLGLEPDAQLDLDALCPEQLLPGRLRGVKAMVFTLDTMHPDWMRFARRIMYRNAVRGKFGLVTKVVVELPSEADRPTLLDLPGFSGSDPVRSKMAVHALDDPNIAVICVVAKDRDSQGAVRRQHAWHRVPFHLLPRRTLVRSRYPGPLRAPAGPCGLSSDTSGITPLTHQPSWAKLCMVHGLGATAPSLHARRRSGCMHGLICAVSVGHTVARFHVLWPSR